MFFRFFTRLFLIAGVLGGSSAFGQTTGVDLAKVKNCLACHQVDAKRVGPSFTVIAQRFKGQQGAAQYLATTIRAGGRGRWGAVPMPAQPHVDPADAQLLAEWILTLGDEASISK